MTRPLYRPIRAELATEAHRINVQCCCLRARTALVSCHHILNPFQFGSAAIMSFRATRTLFNQAKNYASPHSFTYVEGKTPFWRKFRQIFSANPEISSGIPSIESNRWPQPGSRPERSATPPSAASDPASNLYHNRDFRRKYPKLEMITQKDLTTLLLSSPNEDGTRR